MKFIIVVYDVDPFVCLLLCAPEIGMYMEILNLKLDCIIILTSILTRKYVIENMHHPPKV